MSTNNFKVFDETKTNLLSYSNYTNDSQRLNGFDTDEEIPSKLFNSILRQNSIFSYAFIEYAKSYVPQSVVVQHDMIESDMMSFLTIFFNNRLEIGQIKVDNYQLGSLFYVKTEPTQKLIALQPPSDTTKKYVLSYKYDIGQDGMIPYVKELFFFESLNNQAQHIGLNEGLYRCVIELNDDIISNIDDYEILLEMINWDNNYKSIVIPFNRLNAIGYDHTGSIPESYEYFTSGTPIIIFDNLSIGLSDTTSEEPNPEIGKYLTIISIDYDISQYKFNLTIKERI